VILYKCRRVAGTGCWMEIEKEREVVKCFGGGASRTAHRAPDQSLFCLDMARGVEDSGRGMEKASIAESYSCLGVVLSLFEVDNELEAEPVLKLEDELIVEDC